MATGYNPVTFERRWQDQWAADELYLTNNDDDRPKWYFLDMFPYTSGDLHIGHWYAYGPADVMARYMRMKGYNVMRPIGFDSFGLPAENAAIKGGEHPAIWTIRNIDRMRLQLKSMGGAFDWSRDLATCLPSYYRWTQWIFLKLYEAGLAYKAMAPANWCPSCQTVLANEQVIDGGCERCESVVTKKDLEQWFYRITKYAEELLDHSGLDWPERAVTDQRNWIGKSIGVELGFRSEAGDPMPVFTTRPDTTYGVTFMVLAPEHPLVTKLTTPDRKAEVDAYIGMSRLRTEIERLSVDREKTGVYIGAHAVNPLSDERLPIWVADYVLYTYGTGIVMGVPAHDQRDFEFAEKFGVPVKVVIEPPEWDGEPLTEAYLGIGPMINSAPFDGVRSDEGIERVADHVEAHSLGRRSINYRLRDWLVSRQRYWGAPIPVVYCPECGTVPVPEDQLPVMLPKNTEVRPTGESPLKLAHLWLHTECPKCGGSATRETDTMDSFVDSAWYFFRFASPNYSRGVFDQEQLNKWLPVDQYVGGIEHATKHLLYARFITKALRDIGLLDFGEPFLRLFCQGVLLSQGHKMSKSRGNVANPDDFVQRLGADTVRAYLMFVGPWDEGGDWNDQGINGVYRFLNRVWNLVQTYAVNPPADGEQSAERELRRKIHKTIERVAKDIESFRFNTMLAALMECCNALVQAQEAGDVGREVWDEAIQTLLLLLAPIAPHIAEELWFQLDKPYSIHQQSWPEHDPALAADEVVTVVVQVNGRVRERLRVPVGTDQSAAYSAATASQRVQKYLAGKQLRKVIYRQDRLLNIVAG